MHDRYRILRRRLLALLGAPVRPEPVSIDIEPTVRCNLRCAFCQHTSWRRTAPDMTPELFRRVLDSFPGLDEIKLQGMGEPLLNRDLFSMIRAAKARNIHVKTYTNGTLLTQENVAGLVDAGIDEVFVSFDHPDPGTLESLRPGLKFGSFAAGVQRLTVAAQGGRPRVTAWALATAELAGHVAAHLSRAHELGFREVTYQIDLTSWGEGRGSSTQSATAGVRAEIEGAARSTTGLSVSTISTNAFTQGKPCPWPFHHCYVTAEGRVQPCCILSDPGKVTLGDLTRTPLYRIWNGRGYFRFRRSILTNRLLPWCRGCYRSDTRPDRRAV